jgi:hypothetical protein
MFIYWNIFNRLCFWTESLSTRAFTTKENVSQVFKYSQSAESNSKLFSRGKSTRSDFHQKHAKVERGTNQKSQKTKSEILYHENSRLKSFDELLIAMLKNVSKVNVPILNQSAGYQLIDFLFECFSEMNKSWQCHVNVCNFVDKRFMIWITSKAIAKVVPIVI